MGSGQTTTAGHTATPSTTSLTKDYIFPGTALPTGQPVINHYIQACIAYGSVISFSSKSQYGGGATTTTSTILQQQQRPTSGPTNKGKGMVLGRRKKVKPSLGVEGCMRLRQYSYLSPLGSLNKPLGSISGGGGNGGSGGSNGGTTRQSNTDSLHILSDSSGSQQSSFSTPSTFGTVCEEGALDLHTRNARNGKRSSVYNGVYFYVMSSIQEEKVFASHMKGLEAIDVLRLPGVQVPRTAKVFFLGLTIACIELRSLHAISIKGSSATPTVNSPTSPPNNTDMMGNSVSTRAGTSAHGRTVSVMIARAYRLTGDPAILMYENGGGSLIVVDACGLLPALALTATSIKPWHTCRYETLVGYDFPKSIAGSLQGGQVAQPTPSASSTKTSAPTTTTTPYLQAVIHAALHYPKKKDALVGNLNFILAGNGLVGGYHHLDDAFVCTSQPLLTQVSSHQQQQQPAVSIRIPRSSVPNAEFTAVIFNGILPLAFLEAFDSECTSTVAQFMSVQGGGGAVLTNDKRTISQRSFVSLMKRCGLGIHMLGKLWVISQNKSGDNGRALRCHVAIEMLARATKRILHNTLAKTISATTSKHKNTSPANPISHQTVVEAVLSVFRGVAEDGFREAELVPMVQAMFRDNNGDGGGGMVPRVGKDVSYHTMLTRVEELTGIVTDNGSLQSIRPFCRVAKTGAFPVPMSSQEELRLCTVASKREDGMAGAATVCAVSFHRHNCQRIATVLDQLRGRAKFPTDPTATLSETASLMQMFVTMTELTLLTHALHAPTLPTIGASQQQHSTSIQNRIQWLLGAVSEERAAQYIKLTESSEHDKMFIAHFLLLLADRLLRNPPTVFQGALLVRQVLGLGLFQNSTQVHPVASRFLQESLHRVSIEACYGTNQIKEALAISKRWMRSSGALFGGTSEGYFEATRMMMVALIRSKKKKEATRMAQRQYDLAELVYGGKTSIHGVVLSAQQVVDLHCEVSAAAMNNNKPQNNSASRSERNSNSPSGHLSNSAGILRIASAANDLGSLTWRHAPICGLVHFRRAISIYNAVYGPDSKATATATYNIGLALLRLNLFGASQKHIQAARRTALNVDDERGLVQLCEASLKSLSLISATKIQRWYRSIKYGVAKSQTTKSQTDTATTFQSALSWSDELSEISGAGQS